MLEITPVADDSNRMASIYVHTRPAHYQLQQFRSIHNHITESTDVCNSCQIPNLDQQLQRPWPRALTVGTTPL